MNIRDIAKQAKVSVATVSRYLSKDKRSKISPATQKRLEKVIKKHRFVPNRAAQNLSRLSTNTIGMVTPFSTEVVKSPYFEGLIAGIIEGIKPLNMDLKWIMIRDEDAKKTDCQSLIQKHGVDGLIFLVWRLLPKLVKEVQKTKNLPAVLINDYEKKIKSNIVYCENKSGVEALVSRLGQSGYRNFGMIRGPEHFSPDAAQRFNAFKTSLKKCKLPFNPKFTYQSNEFSEKLPGDILEAIVRMTDRPDVLFCANDDIAHAVIHHLQKHKIRVPGDIAVSGFDDSSQNQLMRPALTSVRQPTEEMGCAAVEILSKILAGKSKKPVQMRFEPKVMMRESA